MSLTTYCGALANDPSLTQAKVVTPSDTISPATRINVTRGVWADVAGTITVLTMETARLADTTGSALTAAQGVAFTIPAGSILPLAIAYVLATGTTATGIKGFN